VVTILTLVLVAVGYYLLARAKLTRPLWLRYPAWLDAWATCAACSGTWIGAGTVYATGKTLGWSFASLPPASLQGVILGGLVACYTTPLLALVHTYALATLTPAEPTDLKVVGDDD